MTISRWFFVYAVRSIGVAGVRKALGILGHGAVPLIQMFDKILTASRTDLIAERHPNNFARQSRQLKNWFREDTKRPYADRTMKSLTEKLLEQLEIIKPGITRDEEGQLLDMLPVYMGDVKPLRGAA